MYRIFATLTDFIWENSYCIIIFLFSRSKAFVKSIKIAMNFPFGILSASSTFSIRFLTACMVPFPSWTRTVVLGCGALLLWWVCCLGLSRILYIYYSQGLFPFMNPGFLSLLFPCTVPWCWILSIFPGSVLSWSTCWKALPRCFVACDSCPLSNYQSTHGLCTYSNREWK